MAEKKKTIRERLCTFDIDEIETRLAQEECPINKLLMGRLLATVLESSHGERDTMDAIKQLLAYLKAKPVSRVEHKVTEADEAWAEDIDVDSLMSGKAECKTKPN